MAINDQAPIKSILIKNGNDWDQFPLSATVAAADVTVDSVYDERDDLQLAYNSDVYLDEYYDEAGIVAIANTKAELDALDQRITELSQGVEETIEQRIADGVRGLDLVPSTRTIAGLDLTQDRTRTALKTALSLSKSDVGLGNVTNAAQIPLSGSTAITGTVGYKTSATATTVADSTTAFRNIVVLASGTNNEPSGSTYAIGTIIMQKKT